MSQKHFSVFLLFFICCFLFACHPEKPYKKNGISFTVPAGWKISHEEMDNITGSVTCERSAFIPYGQVLITYINDSLDLKSQIDQFRDLGKLMEMVSHTVLSVPSEGMFHKYPDMVSRLKNLPGNVFPQFEEIYSFYSCGRTFTVVIQQSQKDVADNKNAIEGIVSSFECYKDSL